MPRRSGWREWVTYRNSLKKSSPRGRNPLPVAAELESQTRQGCNYAKPGSTATVDTTDIADAIAITWSPSVRLPQTTWRKGPDRWHG